MQIAKQYFLLIYILIVSAAANAQSFRTSSPDGATQVNLLVHRNAHGRSKFVRPTKKTIDIVHNRESLIRNREIGLTLKARGHRYNFSEAEVAGYNELSRLVDDPDIPGDCVVGVTGLYNGIIMETDIGTTLEVRVYNDGVAYRFRLTKPADEYKILNITPIFPDEKPIAILGTFTEDYDFEWNVLQIKDKANEDKGNINDYNKRGRSTFESGEGHFQWNVWQNGNKGNYTNCDLTTIDRKPRVRGVVSWRDALSSASVGATFNWFTGGIWKNVAQTQTLTADVTYKYLYGAVTYSPSIELLYIYYGEDYAPFTRVMGSIHSWSLGTRLGFNLPIQDGYDIWNITPYVGASLMHLYQHGTTRISYNDVSPHHYYLVGPGIKVQCAVRERLTLGISYEYQFFTDKESPLGMNSLGLTIGWQF